MQKYSCTVFDLRYGDCMKTAHDIIQKIGKPRIKAGLGVSDRAIYEHIRVGILPASWFDFCEKATRRRLDRRLFSFKGERE